MIKSEVITRRNMILIISAWAVAASVVYFGGRALGLGGSSSDGLAFTISVPAICETGQARDLYGGIWGRDEDGNWVETGTYGPFYQLGSLNTAELTWGITGGAEPYEISVQGQTLFSGPAGSTHVYCAESLPYDDLDFTQPRDDYERAELDGRPAVEPGVMTFEAKVEDANGRTAKAKARTYVIVDCDDYCDYEVLPEGYTVRLLGALMPIPKGLKISCCSYSVSHEHSVDGTSAAYYDLDLAGKGGGSIRFTQNGRFLGYHWNGVYYRKDGTTWPETAQVDGQAAEEHPLADELKEFGRWLGRRPHLSDD